MKKFSMIAAAAALAVSTAAPVAAQNAELDDPFLATQGIETTFLLLGGAAATIIIVASQGSGTGSGSGTP